MNGGVFNWMIGDKSSFNLNWNLWGIDSCISTQYWRIKCIYSKHWYKIPKSIRTDYFWCDKGRGREHHGRTTTDTEQRRHSRRLNASLQNQNTGSPHLDDHNGDEHYQTMPELHGRTTTTDTEQRRQSRRLNTSLQSRNTDDHNGDEQYQTKAELLGWTPGRFHRSSGSEV